MSTDWISIHDKLPVPEEGELPYPIYDVLLDDGTLGEGYYEPVKYKRNWMVRHYPQSEFRSLLYTGVHVTHWRPKAPAADVIQEKQCPFDKTTLVNVGALKEFEDGKDNHICPHCRRIWVDVNQEEWYTRSSKVQILGELREGSNYADIIKVLQ